MIISWIVFLKVICLLIHDARTQFQALPLYGAPQMPQMITLSQMPAPPPMPNPYYQQQYPPIIYRERIRHKHRRKKKHDDSDYSDDSSDSCECEISVCDQCVQIAPSSCCKSFCNTCLVGPANPNQGILLVPYPYPIVVSESSEKNSATTAHPETSSIDTTIGTTTKKASKVTNKKIARKRTIEIPSTTTTMRTYLEELIKTLLQSQLKATSTSSPSSTSSTSTTSSTSSPSSPSSTSSTSSPSSTGSFRPEEINDIIFKVPSKGNTKYVLTSLRRIKQNWMPKYGIVPIPDNIASSLITQLRSMKVLQSHRETQSLVTRPTAVDIVENVYKY